MFVVLHRNLQNAHNIDSSLLEHFKDDFSIGIQISGEAPGDGGIIG
ncbi:hypothetical protein [Candidatus Anaplasma sp. TIGMIC]|nr:hypothetical protein [Candidatus Anaplasma sp. TIGMIC]MDB1135066.1 hypothetical protein [Candidatus Anaplasma sp. TIGMIC]